MSNEPLISFCCFLSEMHKCSSNPELLEHSPSCQALRGGCTWQAQRAEDPRALRADPTASLPQQLTAPSRHQEAEQHRSGTLGHGATAGVCAWGNQTLKMLLVWYWACLPLGPTRILPLPAVWFTMRSTCSTIYQQNYHWNRTKINVTWSQDPSEKVEAFLC